jgi:predicted DNA-binding antitoxin AbrB/MazE fold protein
MKHIVGATVINGSFRPDEPLELQDGERVQLIVVKEGSSVEDSQALADEMYNDLSQRNIREIEKIALTSRGVGDGGAIDRAE